MYLVLDDLVKIFPAHGGGKDVAAVDHVSLTINMGELVTLLGPSGCGKTTTLRLIAGFEYPTGGDVILDGHKINDRPPNKRDMAMVFQSYAIFPHLNVYENVAYGLRVKRLADKEIREKIQSVLELTELLGLENRAPNQLSGGQQQRVALARALVMEPKVLLFDEPLSNLDAKLREQMRTEIRRIQKRLGITSVYVTHDQAEAMTLSDRVVIMNKGKVEQMGTPVEIYQRPNSPFVADFIGRANFLDARVLDVTGDHVEIDVLGCRLQVALPALPVSAGQSVRLMVRPEAIELAAQTGEGYGGAVRSAAVLDATPGDGSFTGTVRRAAYLGSVIDYDVEISGQMLGVLVYDPRRKALYSEGEQVQVRIIEECAYLLPGS